MRHHRGSGGLILLPEAGRSRYPREVRSAWLRIIYISCCISDQALHFLHRLSAGQPFGRNLFDVLVDDRPDRLLPPAVFFRGQGDDLVPQARVYSRPSWSSWSQAFPCTSIHSGADLLHDLPDIGGKAVPFLEVHDDKHRRGVADVGAVRRGFDHLALLPALQGLDRGEGPLDDPFWSDS